MSVQQWEIRQGDAASDGPSLAELVARLRGSGRTLLFCGLVGIAAAIFWMVVYQQVNPKQVVYSAAFRFEAKGAKPGHYPNGLEFTPLDIRSPSVLDAVYNAVKRETATITRADLDSMISVSPYSPERELVRNRYVRMLGDKGLTVADRTQLEKEFLQALNEAGPEGTLIRLNTVAGKIPQAAGTAIVESLLDNWSRIFVTEYGVANQPTAVQSKTLVQTALSETEDYPISYRRIEAATSELRARAAELAGLPGTEGITIAGRTLSDVEREADEIDRTAIREILAPLAYAGLSRDANATAKKLAYAAQTMRDGMAELGVQSRMIDEVLNQAQSGFGVGATDETTAPGNTNVSQLGDAAAERLIELAVSNADRPFIQELLREKQEIGGRSASMSTKLTQIERMANAIAKPDAALGSDAALLFSTTAMTATSDLNRLWSELNTLADAASGRNLNPARTLYSRIPLREEMTATGGVSDPRGWAVAVLLVLMSVLVGLAIHLFRSASNRLGTAVQHRNMAL